MHGETYRAERAATAKHLVPAVWSDTWLRAHDPPKPPSAAHPNTVFCPPARTQGLGAPPRILRERVSRPNCGGHVVLFRSGLQSSRCVDEADARFSFRARYGPLFLLARARPPPAIPRCADNESCGPYPPESTEPSHWTSIFGEFERIIALANFFLLESSFQNCL